MCQFTHNLSLMKIVTICSGGNVSPQQSTDNSIAGFTVYRLVVCFMVEIIADDSWLDWIIVCIAMLTIIFKKDNQGLWSRGKHVVGIELQHQ